MVRSATDAVEAALNQTSNKVGTCQMATRLWFAAPSVGDVDGDGDADAVDGWLSEPASARHPGDRNPPVGAPVAFSGGGKKYGHRAITRARGGHIRSTDMQDGRYVAGVTGNATIDQIERSMGVKYLGWTETISRQPIPGLAVSKPKSKRPRLGVIAARARALIAVRHGKLAARYALIAAARLSKSKDPALRATAGEFTDVAADFTKASARLSRVRARMAKQ
jgi:hypothetical protein